MFTGLASFATPLGRVTGDCIALAHGRGIQLRGPDGVAWVTFTVDSAEAVAEAFMRARTATGPDDASHVRRAVALWHAASVGGSL